MEKDQLKKLNNIVTMLVNELTDLKGRIESITDENPKVKLERFYEENPDTLAIINEASNEIMNLRIIIKQIEISRINMLSNLRDIDRILS